MSDKIGRVPVTITSFIYCAAGSAGRTGRCTLRPACTNGAGRLDSDAGEVGEGSGCRCRRGGDATRVEIEREDDGRWIAEVPDLPGVMVYGQTRDEAVSKVKALALRVIADRIEHGETVPEVSDLFAVPA